MQLFHFGQNLDLIKIQILENIKVKGGKGNNFILSKMPGRIWFALNNWWSFLSHCPQRKGSVENWEGQVSSCFPFQPIRSFSSDPIRKKSADATAIFSSDPRPIIALSVGPWLTARFEFCLNCWTWETFYVDFSTFLLGFVKVDTRSSICYCNVGPKNV